MTVYGIATALRRVPGGRLCTAGPPVPWARPFRTALALFTVAGIAVSCSAVPPEPASTARTAQFSKTARIVDTQGPLECVPYARRLSEIALRGDAWTWWQSAAGRYARSSTPAPGAVLVLKRQGKVLGHLAVVSQVVSDRVILAHHANWLNQGRVFRDTPIMDVSEAGDWSAVRVWYPPSRQWGRRTYLAYGFIHREQPVAQLPYAL